jgi:hypothetical protein
MRKGKIMTTRYCSDEQLEQVINTPSTPCAASCGVSLGTLNLINNDTVHEDCRCLYRKCRTPLLAVLDWQRRICSQCWCDPRHDVSKVKLRKADHA